MADVPHVLSLRPAVHLVPRTGRFGRIRQEPIAHYLELCVDGVPLDRLVAHGAGLVTPLQGWWLARTSPVIDELLGAVDGLRLPDGFAPIRYLAAGRVPLLVGPWDDDIHDGWLTARVRVGEATVTWTDFRWENGGVGPAEPVRGLPPVLEFERGAYTATLEAARAQVAALPEPAPAPGSWRLDERVPGVPAGLERTWGAWARWRHRGVER